MALTHHNVEIVKFLQSKGADIHALSSDNECAYHFAAFEPTGKMVAYVATQKVKPTITKREWISPFDNANLDSFDDVVLALFAAKVPSETKDRYGDTPLLNSIRLGRPLAALYAKCAANLNAFDNKGRGFWGSAAPAASNELLEYMYKVKRSVQEASPVNGNTPLHFFVQNDAFQGVTWLLRHGANPNAKNKMGQTPVDMIAQIDNQVDQRRMRALFAPYLKH